MKINKIILITLINFVLNSCGIGLFGVNKNSFIVNGNEDTSQIRNNKCKTEPLMTIGCGEVNHSDKYYLYKINDLNLSLRIINDKQFKLLSFGVLPLIPAPPIIPAFFFPAIGHNNFCGNKNVKIEVTIYSESDIKNIKIDPNNIFLIKDNEKIYPINYEVNNQYDNIVKYSKYKISYILYFPITCDKLDNSLIVIDNATKNNKKINIPSGKIIYNSDIYFLMGYFENN